MVPTLIILLCWFKPITAICSSILLVVAFIFTVKNIKYKTVEEYKKIFNLKKILIFMSFIILINILSGAGGIFYQNWDYKFRNVILHDLIENEWPVKYDYSQLEYEQTKIGSSTGVLSYYFAFWIPAALVGKVTNFTVASIFMLFWQILGTSLFFYLICRKTGKIRLRYFLVFIAFGGVDIITKAILDIMNGQLSNPFGVIHIDTVNGKFVMSTFITQLFWVFNQSVPAWVATMLLINDKQYQNIGVMLAMLVPYSPFPVIGLAMYIIIVCLFGYEFQEVINRKRIRSLISIQNIASVLSVIPIGLLFIQNSSNKGCFIIDAIHNGGLSKILLKYALFVMFEFGIYAVIINKKNWKKILTYFSIFAILPLFYIGFSVDLGNRATIPILVLLYLEILNFIEEYKFKEHKKRIICLAIILFLAFCTNYNELYRSIKNTYKNYKDKVSNFSDNYVTLGRFENKECDKFIKNFVAPYDENKFFYKHILK